MARLAAEMAGAVGSREADPDPAFVEQLRLRMRAADDGVAAVHVTPPVRERDADRSPPSPGDAARGSSPGARCSRVASVRRPGSPPGSSASRSEAAATDAPSLGGDDDLVAGEGFWVEVARGG